MWLLSRKPGSQRIRLTEYVGENTPPPYGILSHTWGPDEEELTFRDVQEQTGQEKAGYLKVSLCLELAEKDGLEFCWVDTCCIDKTNSTELSYAINSFFGWYQAATKCYAYLPDVPERPFLSSRWFDRGWTLQELLAPAVIDFYSSDRQFIGNKTDLLKDIQAASRIPLGALQGHPLTDFADEEKMSWIVHRKTKRPEDMAYALLGIFGVTMPLIYGEGRQQAEFRLRREIQDRRKRTYYDAQCWKLTAQLGTLTPESNDLLETFEPRKRVASSHEDLGDCPDPKRSRADTNDSELDAASTAALMSSLRFAQIESRQLTIKSAHSRTCQWFLGHPQYMAWMDDAAIQSHKGFLWMKGKPGSGKSTMMKFVLANVKKKAKNKAVLSFFFNARGAELEKTTAGAYRTLLVQLLEKFPHLRSVFNILGTTASMISEDYVWSVRTLQDLLREAFQSLNDQSVICIIDALDECNEDDIRDMISFFEDVTEQSSSGLTWIRIFFASRHYPHITIKSGLSLVLEDVSEHSRDIETFLASELRIGETQAAMQIRDELLQRSEGIFMWVCLVVRILNKEHDRGKMTGLRKRLRELPSDLHMLFREILTRDADADADADHTTLACIQWILFATTPLSPSQLYAAMQASEEGFPAFSDDQLTPEITRRSIINASKGLAEITKSSDPTVQFIHESVRDFLLKEDGLVRMWPELAGSTDAKCHANLMQHCRAYLHCDLGHFAEEIESPPDAPTAAARELRESIKNRLPFLQYAVNNLLSHAEVAAGSGLEGDLFSHFDEEHFEHWVKLANVLEKYQKRRYLAHHRLGYVLCRQNCPNLFKRRFLTGAGTFDGRREFYDAMNVLLEKNNETLMESIFVWDKDFLKSYCRGGSSGRIFNHVLQKAAQRAQIKMIKLLLDSGMLDSVDHQTILEDSALEAAYQGHEDTAQALIGERADDQGFQNQLLRMAASRGNEQLANEVVEQLITAGVPADFDILLSAAENRHDSIVNLLSKKWVKANVPAKQNSALVCVIAGASDFDVSEHVKILIRDGADLNVKSEFDLQQPYWIDSHHRVVRMLINNDFNVTDMWGEISYISPLCCAAVQDQEKLVELLVTSGADIDSQALYCAVALGRLQALCALLRGGANPNEQHKVYGNVLQAGLAVKQYGCANLLVTAGAVLNRRYEDVDVWAFVTQGHLELADALLRNGASMLPTDIGNYDHAFRSVCEKGLLTLAAAMIGAGTNVNARLGYDRSALGYASAQGHDDVVKLLIENGADVNIQDMDSQHVVSPVCLAALGGHEQTVEILIKKGANLNPTSQPYQNALWAGVSAGNERIVKRFIAAGAGVDALPAFGPSFLAVAWSKGDKKIAEMLIQAGARSS